MKVSRQFIAWYRCENGNRPVGYGMIGSDRRATSRTINQPGVGIRPCPTGRILDWTRFQAINCLATIISPFGTTNRQYLSTFSNPPHSAHTDSRTRTRNEAPGEHPQPADAGCNSDLAQYSNTPSLRVA